MMKIENEDIKKTVKQELERIKSKFAIEQEIMAKQAEAESKISKEFIKEKGGFVSKRYDQEFMDNLVKAIKDKG